MIGALHAVINILTYSIRVNGLGGCSWQSLCATARESEKPNLLRLPVIPRKNYIEYALRSFPFVRHERCHCAIWYFYARVDNDK